MSIFPPFALFVLVIFMAFEMARYAPPDPLRLLLGGGAILLLVLLWEIRLRTRMRSTEPPWWTIQAEPGEASPQEQLAETRSSRSPGVVRERHARSLRTVLGPLQRRDLWE